MSCNRYGQITCGVHKYSPCKNFYRDITINQEVRFKLFDWNCVISTEGARCKSLGQRPRYEADLNQSAESAK